jgi:hypothetical protein
MNVPRITSETQLPFELQLNGKGGPLEGLKGWKVEYGRIRRRYYVGVWQENGSFLVMTIGHTAQTQRRRQFRSREDMVRYVNAWVERTIERGLAKRPATGMKALSDMLMVAFKND